MKATAVVALAALSHATGSRAETLATEHPQLAAARAALDAARGPSTITELRGLWGTWGRADPDQVEAALREAAGSPRLDAPTRAYAELLVAYARLRRGDVATARALVTRLGYVQSWFVVGPFDNEGRAGLDQRYGPEAALGAALDLGQSFPGKERPVRWRLAPLTLPWGWLDFGATLRPADKVCGYATTFVSARAPGPPLTQLSLWVGAAGAFELFWNGASALREQSYRGYDADRYAVTLPLAPGPNTLSVKVCGDPGAPMISVRLADPSGAPEPRLVAQAEPSLAKAAASHVAAAPWPKPASGVRGPLQEFTRLTTGRGATAAQLHAFARYLDLTSGDDTTAHQARDLARRAAELSPTVPRLLLAGWLSEDPNQMREWVGRARQQADRERQETIELLLAEAALARHSPDPHAASQAYERILARDPDELGAIQGRVELLNQVGLGRSAAALLEQALERSPKGVLLLSMLASQRRALGELTAAAELESRYLSYRFDDKSAVGRLLELALARRDRAAAERWTARLLALDPDAQWAHATAARAYRALGQPERAVEAYQQALRLAPEDVDTLRALANLHGELGHTDEQLSLLRSILRLRPQDREVREYVEHIEPPKPRTDEAWAWAPERFLARRGVAAAGQLRRTLRDLTVTTVYPSGLSSTFRQVVFQPLTDVAAAAARQYALQYQADREVVQLRQARVFRTDGRVDESIESGELPADDPSIAMYTSARTFYVQLPRLEPGDVVELRYRLDQVGARNEFGDYFGDVTYLQSSEPVENAEYVLVTPTSRHVYVDSASLGVAPTVTTQGERRTHRWQLSALPPVVQEPLMPPWGEVLRYVHASTFKDWASMGRWYWALVRDQLDLDDETRALARKIGAGKTTDLEKVKAVYAWVTENTRYVALEFGIYGFKPRRCVQTVARGWGDCKDKATAIVTLLEELGVPATLVIVRTRQRGGWRSSVASLAPFDHAIAYVPSLELYLDGTAEHTGVTELPKMDLGALGLQVNAGNAKLVTLPGHDPKRNVIERRVHATLGPSGEAKLELGYVTRGVDAPAWRRRYLAESTRRDRLGEDLGSEFAGFSLTPGAAGVPVAELSDVEAPVRLELRGSSPSFARREAAGLSVPVTSGLRYVQTYAALTRRTQPVTIIAHSTRDDTFTVRLPAGMKLLSAPAASSGSTRFGSWSLTLSEQAGEITVKSRVELSVDQVSPRDYQEFRAFCAAIDTALTPRLVVGR